jgi:hypothetical protein
MKYYHSTHGVAGADVHSNWRIVQSCLAPEIQIRTAPDFPWITTFAQKCGTGYLAVLEVEALMSARSHLSIFSAHRQAVESSSHATPAIFERCPKDISLPAVAVAEEVFNLAHDLFTFTHRYEQIDYSYRLMELKMTLDEFRKSLTATEPPAGLTQSQS